MKSGGPLLYRIGRKSFSYKIAFKQRWNELRESANEGAEKNALGRENTGAKPWGGESSQEGKKPFWL